jgi:hypothetical protein
VGEGIACHIEVRQLYELEDFEGLVEEKTTGRFREIGMR